MTRSEFSKQIRRDSFLRAKGSCEECGRKLAHGEAEYHHATEDFMGGEPTLANCQVLCKTCHATKTIKRRPVVDKTRRQSDKRQGIRKPSRMLGSRNSPLKKKLNGEVVAR